MVYCIQIYAAFSTAARRDAVLGDIQTRIASKPRWSVDMIEAQVLRPKLGEFGLIAELRFVSRADMDDLQSRIESFASGQRAPQAGSLLRVHSCTHDESRNECVIIAERLW